MFNNDLPKIIRGRTAGSQNLLHLGFRYSKSGKLTQDGRQAWRCVKKDDRCPGRVYTDSRNNLTSFKQPHCHGPDLADCELQEVFSNVADLAENTDTAPYLIHCSTTGGISEETILKLPSEDAIKKRAQRTRRKKNPRPTAPTCLADLQIDDDDCTSLAGDLMLQLDNNDEEKRIIILATARNLDILGRGTVNKHVTMYLLDDINLPPFP